MEEAKPKIVNKPQPLESMQKLKIYAVHSVHNDFKEIIPKEMQRLTLAVGFDLMAIIVLIGRELKEQGLNPEQFSIINSVVVSQHDQLIEVDAVSTSNFKAPEFTTKDERKEQSKDKMIAHARYIFEKSGTESEIVILDAVIRRFKKYDPK